MPNAGRVSDMGIFKGRGPKEIIVAGVEHFRWKRQAQMHFAEKYAFVGEQLQKLCADTGLLSVEAKVDTGTWFLENAYKGCYEKYSSIKVFATANKWEVDL